MSNPIVDSVVVASDLSSITVAGSGFKPSSTAPSVRFDGTVLTVGTSSDTAFTATLPGGLVSGSYLLEVENSDTFSLVKNFSVAVVNQNITSFYSNIFQYSGNLPIELGYVKNLALTSTAIQIPLVGTSISDSGKMSTPPVSMTKITGFQVFLTPFVPSSAGTFSVHIKNITSGNSTGTINISNPGNWGQDSTALNVSSNDTVMMVLSVSGSPVTFDSIQFTTSIQ